MRFLIEIAQRDDQSGVRFMELLKKQWPDWEGETEIRQIFGPETFPLQR
jgi:hypothetical protein